MSRLFDHVATQRCVLFFDEFETLGKERGDPHETGEIKRVVSSLLMQIDGLPSHVMVIAATNHAELLDRAVWRRFQMRIQMPGPTRERIEEWFKNFEKNINIPLEYAPRTLADRLRGSNFAEIEEFGMTVFRRYVLGQPAARMKDTISFALKEWPSRTVKSPQQNKSEDK